LVASGNVSTDPEAVVNGDVELSWSELEPLALESAAAATLAAGDLLIGLAPESFSVWLARASGPSQVEALELGGVR
jgi:hypothetical protein